LAGSGGGAAQEILAESGDPTALLSSIREPAFFVRALDHARAGLPERWPDLFAELLPVAPVEGCEAIARALDASGHRDRLDAALQRIPTDFTRHLQALCWLWRG